MKTGYFVWWRKMAMPWSCTQCFPITLLWLVVHVGNLCVSHYSAAILYTAPPSIDDQRNHRSPYFLVLPSACATSSFNLRPPDQIAYPPDKFSVETLHDSHSSRPFKSPHIVLVKKSSSSPSHFLISDFKIKTFGRSLYQAYIECLPKIGNLDELLWKQPYQSLYPMIYTYQMTVEVFCTRYINLFSFLLK